MRITEIKQSKTAAKKYYKPLKITDITFALSSEKIITSY